jgi:hypothetical protein
MATNKNDAGAQQSSSGDGSLNTFNTGMMMDIDDIVVPQGVWLKARNAINNSDKGHLGVLGNEPSNVLCQTLTDSLTIIGMIYLTDGVWSVFSSNNIDSEIGVYYEDSCSYEQLFRDRQGCLNFKTTNLIKGVSKENFDCTRQLYWDDGLNPSRTLALNKDFTKIVDEYFVNNRIRTITTPGTSFGGVFTPGSSTVNPNQVYPQNLQPTIPTSGSVTQLSDNSFILVQNGWSVQYSFQSPTTCNGNQGSISVTRIDRIGVADEIWPRAVSINQVNWTNMSFNDSTSFNGLTAGTYTLYFREAVNININTSQTITLYDPVECITDSGSGSGSGNGNSNGQLQNSALFGDSTEFCEIDDYDETQLDCDKIRLATLVNPPCVSLRKSNFAGSIANGSYQVFIAYTINDQRVTDYIGVSNVQSLFAHENINSSLEIVVSSIDERFDEYELVIVSFFNQQTVAKKLGIYSTATGTITVDYINTELTTVPISQLPLISTVYEKSEAMYRNGDYLLRVSPTGYLDFNYQLRANQITTKWFATAYPEDYYVKGGNKTTYLRDEVYSFFIRWVYDTGYKSPSFHIPGREKTPYDESTTGIDHSNSQVDATESSLELWKIKNTASKTLPVGPIDYNTALPNSGQGDGGIVVAEGLMGYWESTELYPNDKEEIWGDNCGRRIRHHKFPDVDVIPHFYGENTNLTYLPDNGANNTCNLSKITQPNRYAFTKGKNYKIIILGVKFDDILPPVDEFGNTIPGIIGYEILRGTRENNRTVIAKGVVSNLREYDFPEFSGSPNQKKGLFLNYPFNDLRDDELLSTNKVDGGCKPSCDISRHQPLRIFNKTNIAFHSPDTNFGNPFLDIDEIKYTAELNGLAEGKFTQVNKHPRHALPNDGALIVAGIFGFIQGLNFTVFSGGFYGASDYTQIMGDKNATATGIQKKPPIDSLPFPVDELVSIVMKPISLIYYTIAVTQGYLDTMLALMSTRQYALQHKSHCFYSQLKVITPSRQNVIKSAYVKDVRQTIDDVYTINNIYRTNFVWLNTSKGYIVPTTKDTSRYSVYKVLGRNGIKILDPTNKLVSTTSSCMYASLKVKIRNLYGQLNSIRQLPISNCLYSMPAFSDPSTFLNGTGYTIYGGDNYIGRYTEKNTFFFFYEWLMDQPDEIEFDYRKYVMIPYPRYWINTEKYDTSQMLRGIFPSFLCNQDDTDGENSINRIEYDSYEDSFPSDNASLTRSPCKPSFSLKRLFCGGTSEDTMFRIDGWFYLFYSGVKDFFVESEINLAHRDYDEPPEKRFYDKNSYTDLDQMFDTPIIKRTNYYKYDKSLSISKYANAFPSWGTMQPRSYNPAIAASCYQNYPKRVIYSLPSSKEQKKDYWKTFLAFNYKDFSSTVTSISPISKNGAMIHFKDISPTQFIGVDTLQTDIGTKITIGDGGLFNQALQNIVNTDAPYEYGSCQDRMSIINTPFGLFWMSQDQGKIFQYGGQIKEISAKGMRWWFARYLKYELITAFPEFSILQNPVAGIGCQAIYDNKNQIIYFSKRDYKPLNPNIVHDPVTNKFTLRTTGLKIFLTDPRYFEDASWTISYDPKTEAWISFHDWHPNFMIPERNTFTTVIGGSFWKHNNTCTSYCNFYDVDYPFEIETIVNTGQTVTTTRSVEYMMEAYRYANNCFDGHHLLDYNFDEMIVYNSEQISGLLKLNLNGKSDPIGNLQYPIVNPAGYIDVLYSKEENKYRVNQFYDITLDRGEFTGNTNIVWNTNANGYIRDLNQASLNYTKNALQHKKFRHYSNKVLFRKNVNNNIKMLFKIFNVKQQISLR